MTTRLKTVQYAFPTLASLANNTLTNLTQITIYLPETGTKTFKSVVAKISMDDIVTATGGSITTKTFGLRLGAAAYANVSNANTLTHSGENLSLFWAVDFTSHFATNWTGASMTCDLQATVNQSTGTTLGMVNVCVVLEITYEYDDTASTHVKTVMIPLAAGDGVPFDGFASLYDTFPALDTYCPEASKTFRQIFIVIQENEQRNSSATDYTITIALDATSVTTDNYEGALASDRWHRYVAHFNGIATNVTHEFLITGSISRAQHMQCYAVVTYEFDPSSTTRVLNSQCLPMDVASPMGGTASTDHQRATREMWIPEPGTINNARVAFYAFWSQPAPVGGLNMRIGTGAFVGINDVANALCGGNGAMLRNDSAFTLARGRNALNFDVYRTDTSDLGWGVCGFWLINYHSDKASAGVGAHSQTIFWGLSQYGVSGAVAQVTATPTVTPAIPESNYFISALGLRLEVMTSGTTTPTSFNVLTQRQSAEGGPQWDGAYIDAIQGDAEVGVLYQYAQIRSLFQRWPGDSSDDRMDIETSRSWRIVNGGNAGACWYSLDLVMVYHSIQFVAADSISGFTGTVTLGLHRAATGEKVLETTRSGDGSFSFTWYDDTEAMFVSANDGTNVGRSADAFAA